MLMKWVEYERTDQTLQDPRIFINARYLAAVRPGEDNTSWIHVAAPALGGDGLCYRVKGSPQEILTKAGS